MARLYNLARMTTATTGTGTMTLGAAVSGFLSFSAAGIADGETITYAIKEGTSTEIGRGVYTASGTTLTRSVLRSTNSDTPISLSGSAQVFITAAAEDFEPRVNAQTGTSYTVASSDFGKTVTFSNASAIAVTLPQATAAFGSGWHAVLVNVGSSTVTITPTTSLIAGASSFTLNRNQAVRLVSDGTNWIAIGSTGLRGAASTVASASTADIGATITDRVSITGTTTITSLGTVPNVIRFVTFAGALSLTYNASSLILPGGATIVTAANDSAVFSSDASGNWTCLAYQRASGVRERLTASRTYYVRTDGSDSNTGLANTSGGAFLTLQKAADVIFGSLDLGGQSVTVQVGSGTYTSGVSVSSPQVGAGTITFTGDTTTPSNVLVSVTSTNCFGASGAGTKIRIQGFKMATTTSGSCVYVATNGSITLAGKCEFGACATSHLANYGGRILSSSINHTISGGAQSFIINDSGVTSYTGGTTTISGTPAFSVAFVYALSLGMTSAYSTTFSGSATGTRYSVTSNAVCQTFGSGSTYLPGNAAGSTATGGQYI